MPRILSENVRGAEELRTIVGLPFSDLIPLGKATGATRRLDHLDNMPRGKMGIYAIWISAGGAGPVLIYGGKCAATGEGIRHRIRTELNPKQNELSPSELRKKLQGPSRVFLWLQEIGVSPDWHISFAELSDSSAITRHEQAMLMRIDFIANTQFNGVLRLEALEGYFKRVAPPPSIEKEAVVGPIDIMESVTTEKVSVKPKKAAKPVPKAEFDSAAAIAYTLAAIQSDHAVAKAALAAVGILRSKLSEEIGVLKSQLDAKQHMLDELSL